MAFLKQQEIENTYNNQFTFLKIGSDIYNIKITGNFDSYQILKNNEVFFEKQEPLGVMLGNFLGFYNNYIYYKVFGNICSIYKIDLTGNNSLITMLSTDNVQSYTQGISNKYLFISSELGSSMDSFYCTVINLENDQEYTVVGLPIIYIDDNFLYLTTNGQIGKVPYTIKNNNIVPNQEEVQIYEGSFGGRTTDCFFGSIENNDTIVVLLFRFKEGSGNQYNTYSIALSKNELTFNVTEEFPLDIIHPYGYSNPAVIDNTFNLVVMPNDISTIKLYILSFDSVEETPIAIGNFISKDNITTPFTKIKFIDKNGTETELTSFDLTEKGA